MPFNNLPSPAQSRSYSRQADRVSSRASRCSSRPEWPHDMGPEPTAPLASRFGMASAASEAFGSALDRAAAGGFVGLSGNGGLTATCSGSSSIEKEPGHREQVWLTLREGQLFLAPKSRDWTPYAFLSMSDEVAYSVNDTALLMTLSPCAKPAGKRWGDSGRRGGAPPHLLVDRLLKTMRVRALRMMRLSTRCPTRICTWSSYCPMGDGRCWMYRSFRCKFQMRDKWRSGGLRSSGRVARRYGLSRRRKMAR